MRHPPGNFAKLLFTILLMLLVIYFLAADIVNVLTPITQNALRSLKGGSWLGYRLGYFGTLVLMLSMFYSVVKRLSVKHIRFLGGRRLWLQIHIVLAIVGSTAILIHTGLPFSFRYYDPFKYIRLIQGGGAGLVGFAGLATWFLPLILISGFAGRYLLNRFDSNLRVWFRYWHTLHILLTAGLYVTGLIHLMVVVWLRFITI